MFTSGQLREANKHKKRKGESIFDVVARLQRDGKLEDYKSLDKPKGARLVSRKAVRDILARHSRRLGAGVIEELERVVMVQLDAAIKAAKMNQRKTVKPADVRGDSVRI